MRWHAIRYDVIYDVARNDVTQYDETQNAPVQSVAQQQQPWALRPGRGPLQQAAHQPAAQAYVHTHTHDHIDQHAHQGARACVRRVRATRGEERAAATQQRSKCTGAGEFRVFGAHHRAPRQGVPTRVCAPKWTSMTPNDEACSSNRRAAHPPRLLGEHLGCDLPRCCRWIRRRPGRGNRDFRSGVEGAAPSQKWRRRRDFWLIMPCPTLETAC